jgi:transcriptional regulator with XRE-family HTH domain
MSKESARHRAFYPAKGSLWLTRSYNFIDRDPEIDVFRTAWQEEGISLSQLAVLAGLGNSTVNNMLGNKPKNPTRRPAHSTFGKMAGAMGYGYALSRAGRDKPNYQAEIPLAVAQRRKYREAAAQARKKPKPKKKK